MSTPKVNGHLLCAVDTDWSHFEKDVRSGMGTISNIHNSVTRMELHLTGLDHLTKLDEIAAQLKSLNDNLIGPATSLERIPFKVLWIQFIFFFITLLVCATLFLVERVKNSDIEVTAGSNGLTINSGSK